MPQFLADDTRLGPRSNKRCPPRHARGEGEGGVAQAKVRGNRMPFGGLADTKDAHDVIAYLKDYK